MGPVPELSDLIKTVNEKAQGEGTLDRLETAAQVSQDLDSLTDELLGHFVNEARASGASWSQIGERLQVSKQAAQQRFAAKLTEFVWASISSEGKLGGIARKFDRFTPRARKTLAAAIAEAHNWNHNDVGTEHILMGLLSEPDGIAAKALDGLGITGESIRTKIGELLDFGDTTKLGASPISPRPPFTPRARKVLELSFKEALQLGHNYIGTEHILLGLIEEGEGIAAQVLKSLRVDHGKIRAKVLELLTGQSSS